MKKLSIVFSALLLIIAFSCNNNNITKQNEIKIDKKGIATLINFIDFNVNQLSLSGFKDYGNKDALAKSVVSNVSVFEKQYGITITNGNSNPRISSDNSYVTSMDEEIAQRLLFFSQSANDEVEYLSKIATLKNDIYSYDLSTSEKEILLNKITFIEEMVNYMSSKYLDSEVIQANAKKDSWWSSWGKCAAGILGGAGTGALTFGLGGAAVGTVTLPVVGTVAAGAVGAIGGAIAGGLTGAAASCD